MFLQFLSYSQNLDLNVGNKYLIEMGFGK